MINHCRRIVGICEPPHVQGVGENINFQTPCIQNRTLNYRLGIQSWWSQSAPTQLHKNEYFINDTGQSKSSPNRCVLTYLCSNLNIDDLVRWEYNNNRKQICKDVQYIRILKNLTFGFRLQQLKGTPQASLDPISLDEQLK